MLSLNLPVVCTFLGSRFLGVSCSALIGFFAGEEEGEGGQEEWGWGRGS